MAVNFGKFSVNNGVFINILMVILLALGFFSVARMPQEQFPEIPFFWANVIVPYPGASADDVEKNLTVKIENAVEEVDRLKQIVSVSQEGLSVVRVEFDDGISNQEFDTLYQEVQSLFTKVELPEGVLNPVVTDFSASDFLPVIEIVLSGDTDYSILNKTANLLSEKLQTINQVSKIDLIGSRDRQVIIDANKDKLESLGISLNEIVQAIQQRNIAIPGGTLTTESREYILRTFGEVEDYTEFNKVIVRRNMMGGGGVVHIGDIADVREEYDPDGIAARFNGQQAISLRIAKVPRGNSTKVVDEVKTMVAEFSETLPEGMQLDLFNDSTLQIRDSINVLLTNSLYGFILLVIILMIFIGFRNALITALGIPITFAATFLILDSLGETFNSNTLFGLVLVLGLIVDHAIVIIENSYRLQQEGFSRIDAAIKGTNEVVKPVIASTLTTVAAFLPLMLLPGVLGKFLRVIPLVVSIALLTSTFEAIVFLPVHYVDWSGKIKKKSRDIFEGLKKGFRKFITAIYTKRRISLVIMFLGLIAGFSLIATVEQDLFSAEDYTIFYIDIELPAGTTREKTDAVVTQFEQKLVPLIGNGEVISVNSSIGFSSGSSQNVTESNVAQITVDLTEKNEGRTRDIIDIITEAEQLTAGISGLEKLQFRKAQNGPPVSPPVSFRIFGNNYNTLISIAEEIERKLADYPELYNINDSLEKGTPELRITVNKDLAAQYGLSTALVGSFIRGSFDGIKATTIFKDNEEVEVIVKYAYRGGMSVRELTQLKIPTPDGRLIPFSAVCSVEEVEPLASIRRLDGKREVTITSEALTTENVRMINSDIEAMFNEDFAQAYPDVILKVGGEFADFDTLLLDILRIFLIGVFLIYMILGTQFKSYTQPVLIIFTIPFAFLGVVLFLALSGTPFSTTVLYSGVALAGIAVNDSIVLISFINELRQKGYAVGHAVIEAAVTRLRPILLTSLTTIAGLMPTALGLGGKSVVWGPMASTIIFGLIFSTFTALVIIPCLYGIFYDKKKRKGKDELPAVRESLPTEA